MRPVLFVLALVGCADTLSYEVAELPGASVSGALPAGFDVASLGEVQPGEIVVVGQPGSAEMAVVQATERGAYVAVGSATCVDCIDPDCDTEGSPNFDRTIEVDVALVGGSGLETMETVTLSSTNFTNPSTYTFTPAVDPHNETISVTGTLAACSTFSYRFDLQEVAPPSGFSIPFIEDFEDADITYSLSNGEHDRTTNDYFKRTDNAGISVTGGASYTNVEGSMFFAGEDLDDDGRPNTQDLTITDIDISGAVRPVVSFRAGAGSTDGFEAVDFLRLQAVVDGGTPIDLFTFTGATGAMVEVSRGATLDTAFRTFSAAIPNGSSVNLRVTMSLNAANEELAFDAIEVFDDPMRTVFVSSSAHTGNLGGIAGADQICQNLAQNAGHPGEFAAWLSTDIPDSPSVRFDQRGSFERVDGSPIALDWVDLTDGTLVNDISLDESGALVIEGVWTNTNADGSPTFLTSLDPFPTCTGFTSTGGLGVLGSSINNDPLWTAENLFECDNLLRVYCFEQ